MKGRAAERAGLAGGARRCAADSRQTGEQCKNAPIRGGTVCRFHGGAAPQVKQKAALRLAQLVDPAIATLGREMVKAEKSSDRQRAANSILDRAGITRQQVSEIDTARALLVARLIELREQPRPLAAVADDAVELVAEVVDDPPAPKPRRSRAASPTPRKRSTKEPS